MKKSAGRPRKKETKTISIRHDKDTVAKIKHKFTGKHIQEQGRRWLNSMLVEEQPIL